jgi:hypothetical protein
MLQQQTQHRTYPKRLIQPKRLDIFLHIFKTFRLMGALLADRQIHILRKLAFLGSVGVLLALLLFPDIPIVLSAVLPIIGTALGVPIDAGIDWTVFALLLVSLLRLFPAERVSEHYARIFEKRR